MKLVLLCAAVLLVQGKTLQFTASNLPPCPADYNKLVARCYREVSLYGYSSTRTTDHFSNNSQINMRSTATNIDQRELGCSHQSNTTVAYRACCRGESVFPNVDGRMMSLICKSCKLMWRLQNCLSNFNLLNCYPSKNTDLNPPLVKMFHGTSLNSCGDGFEGYVFTSQCVDRYMNGKIQPDYAYLTLPKCNVASLPKFFIPDSCMTDVAYSHYASSNEYGCILENQVNCIRDNRGCVSERYRNICGSKSSQYLLIMLQKAQTRIEKLIKVQCNLVNRNIPAALQAEELKRLSSRILHSLAIKKNINDMKTFPTQTGKCSSIRIYLRLERFWLHSFAEYSDYNKLRLLKLLNEIPDDLFRSCCEPSRLRRVGDFIGMLIEECPTAEPLRFINDTIEAQCALLKIADKTHCPVEQYLSFNIPKPGPCFKVVAIVEGGRMTTAEMFIKNDLDMLMTQMNICLYYIHKEGKKILASNCNSQVSAAFEHTMAIKRGWNMFEIYMLYKV